MKSYVEQKFHFFKKFKKKLSYLIIIRSKSPKKGYIPNGSMEFR